MADLVCRSFSRRSKQLQLSHRLCNPLPVRRTNVQWVFVRLDIAEVATCPLSETVRFIVRRIMAPVTQDLIYP